MVPNRQIEAFTEAFVASFGLFGFIFPLQRPFSNGSSYINNTVNVTTSGFHALSSLLRYLLPLVWHTAASTLRLDMLTSNWVVYIELTAAVVSYGLAPAPSDVADPAIKDFGVTLIISVIKSTIICIF